ncbi:MAG TPA: NAD(P)H-dependent oxidoreductase subunit E [candidate division Zixibacteria bacterium]|nr:NAD(P)H-dependent oxidoreductase subunit E [candidate division Zixibacteria bacterium]
MAIPGAGIAQGMWTTLRNFFQPKVTRQYPDERPQMPERWRGRLDLIYDPFGEHKCEVCFQCAQVCPVEAIDMSGFDSQGNRIRYGMPEIYDERRDPNAYRRAGLPARPMRNPARWQGEVDEAWVAEVVDGFRARPEALVAIFGAVQERYGYLPEPALRLISSRMTIHWAQVFGAAGLGGFRLLPAEGHLVTVCVCPACHFSGGRELLRAVTEELGIQPGETTDDGAFTLETSPDVGAGALAPAIRIDTLVYGPVTPEQARHLLEQRRAATAERATAGAGAS